jgi:hypothetical protein
MATVRTVVVFPYLGLDICLTPPALADFALKVIQKLQ